MDLRQYMQAFLQDAQEQIVLMHNALATLHNTPSDPVALKNLHRAFHTLKSTAGTMQLSALSALCRTEEETLKTILLADQPLAAQEWEAAQSAAQRLEAELARIASAP